MSESEMSIERVRALHGHDSAETAYLVEDYPYGYSLRCQIRYWIETAQKGVKKGQQRVVSQTTNPKKNDMWNKPKAGTYNLMAGLYLDGNDRVKSWTVSEYLPTPQGDARLRLSGIYDQMPDDQRALYDALVKQSRHYAAPWDEWDRVITELAAFLAPGQQPDITNGVWTPPTGKPRYLSDPAAYLTAARQRNGTTS